MERHCLNPKFGANSLLRPELSPAAGPGPLLAWRRHGAVFDNAEYIYNIIIVKLRRGSGKDRQGMAPKAKGLKA